MREDIIVLAGGWSVSQFNIRNLERRGTLIAVNDAGLFTKPDVVVTRDRLWYENRYDMLKTLGVPEIWAHRGVVKGKPPLSTVNLYDGSDKADEMHGSKLFDSNSGSVALSLAYHRAESHVFLLGFDMQRGPKDEKHWYPDYPWSYTTKPGKFEKWVEEFAAFADAFKKAGVKVFNVGDRSRIEVFDKITYEQFLFFTSDR